MCRWSLKAGRATGGGLGYIGFSCSYFEHGQDDMRPHVSISLIDFVGNGLEGGETLHLFSIFHFIWHILLHSILIEFIHCCLENVVFSNSVHHVDPTITLVGIGCKMRHSLLDCILHFISFLLLCIWNLLAKLDASPLQNECILLAVPQVNVDARRGLGNCNGIWWSLYLLGNSGTEKWEHIFKIMSNYNNHGFGF